MNSNRGEELESSNISIWKMGILFFFLEKNVWKMFRKYFLLPKYTGTGGWIWAENGIDVSYKVGKMLSVCVCVCVRSVMSDSLGPFGL